MSLIPLLIKPDYTKFYNINRLYSYQDINMFCITGGRGTGKTTGVAIKVIQNYNGKKEQFFYNHRYKTDIPSGSETWLDGVTTGIKKKSLMKGGALYGYYYNNELIGYEGCLTAQAKYKSAIDFSAVTTIIYDEAIIMRDGKMTYLPNEIHYFFELISTIVRHRTNYKIFLLGNNLDMFNPYYEFFNVPKFKNKYIDKTRGIYFEEIPVNKELRKMEEDTPLFKITKGTTYGAYHYDNEILQDNTPFKQAVKEQCDELICRCVYNDITLNFYLKRDKRSIFVEIREKKIVDSSTYVIMEHNKVNYGMVKMFKASGDFKWILTQHAYDRCYYQNIKAKTLFDMIINQLV